jgi:hypothetical protein
MGGFNIYTPESFLDDFSEIKELEKAASTIVEKTML